MRPNATYKLRLISVLWHAAVIGMFQFDLTTEPQQTQISKACKNLDWHFIHKGFYGMLNRARCRFSNK